MLEQAGPSIALLLLMIAAILRCRLWQREQEAKAIVMAIGSGDCAELLLLLAGVPRLGLVNAFFGEPALILAIDGVAGPNPGIPANIEIVDLLLRRGAAVNDRGTEWKTALMHAARLGQTEICLLLLEFGADADACDAWGQTAAQIAREWGHGRLSRLLEQAQVRAH